jgi:hypothetical protein
MFSEIHYKVLHSLVFRPDYPGWKPDVKELPNGDGKVDDKKYAHIALKYLPGFGTAEERNTLVEALFLAHAHAERVADAFSVPKEFRPDMRYGALRVLEYRPGQLSHPHKDFNLFTLQLYRDKPANFIADLSAIPAEVRELNSQCIIGEMGEVIGLGPATLHEVPPLKKATQHSIVYFAIPDWDAKLPGFDPNEHMTVKSWLNERMARSRTAFKSYE